MTSGVKLGKRLVHESQKLKKCMNCRFAWLHASTGFGHCGYGSYIYPRDIEEWESCRHWEVNINFITKPPTTTKKE